MVAPTQTASGVGSSFVTMEIDRGLLPDRIEFARNWNSYFGPHEVGAELMAAYRAAITRWLERSYAGDRWPSPRELSTTAVPDHRTRLILLLGTTTWDEYSRLASSMIGGGHFEARSGADRAGGHAVVVTADRRYLESVVVDSRWAAMVRADEITAAVLRCCARIRSARPDFTAPDCYPQYSIAAPEHELELHRNALLLNRVVS